MAVLGITAPVFEFLWSEILWSVFMGPNEWLNQWYTPIGLCRHDACRCLGAKSASGHQQRPFWLLCDNKVTYMRHMICWGEAGDFHWLLEYLPLTAITLNQEHGLASAGCMITHDCFIGISHYNEVIMGAMASRLTGVSVVYSTGFSDADQRKHQSTASLALVRGIHKWAVNSPHKKPVTRKMFSFDDVFMPEEKVIIMMKFYGNHFVCLHGDPGEWNGF